MGSAILTGLLAGVASAVVFGSAATASVLAKLLFLLVPLPLIIAGLGWGIYGSLGAVLGGLAMLGATFGPGAALAHSVAFAVPAGLITHLALLARPTPAQNGGSTTLEWYPLGRVIGWMAILAGGYAALLVTLFGGSAESFETSVRDLFDSVVMVQLDDTMRDQITPEQREGLVVFLTRLLPVMASVTWFGLMALNLWLGAKITAQSGRLARPWPAISAFSLPGWLAGGLALAMLASLAGGMPGIIASGFAGALWMAFTLLGLATLHFLTQWNASRTYVLMPAYLALIFLPHIASFALTVLGLAEQMFGLRARAVARRGGPGSPGGSGGTGNQGGPQQGPPGPSGPT